MRSQSGRLGTLKTLTHLFIYGSTFFGALLLVQLYPISPSWLFYSVLTGWIAYLVTAVFVARGLRIAYPVSLLLAILTLAVFTATTGALFTCTSRVQFRISNFHCRVGPPSCRNPFCLCLSVHDPKTLRISRAIGMPEDGLSLS
jgi:hypothetical protein